MGAIYDENGKQTLIKNNPAHTLIYAKNTLGNPVALVTDSNGYLRVVTDIAVSSVTATDVTIHDPVTTANKLKINADGSVPVQLTGSFATIKSAPVVGVKTVTSTVAELFAGASRQAGRYLMAVYNESTVPVYWGSSGVTTANGFTLLPGDSITFQFDSSIATAIYFVSSSNATVRVVEL